MVCKKLGDVEIGSKYYASRLLIKVKMFEIDGSVLMFDSETRVVMN